MLLGRKPIGTVGVMSGVPAVLTEFCWSLVNMVQYNSEHFCSEVEYVKYLPAPNSFHAYARNSFVDRMEGDVLLMLDTDHVFDPDTFARMYGQMNAAGIDVLVGVYVHKGPPHAPVLFQWPDDSMPCPIGAWDAEGENTEGALYPIDTAGAGCLMVRRCVFDRIISELKEAPFSITHPFGEDHSFFKRLKTLGIPAYFDPRIEANHLRVQPLSLADFDRDAVKIGERQPTEGIQWQRP